MSQSALIQEKRSLLEMFQSFTFHDHKDMAKARLLSEPTRSGIVFAVRSSSVVNSDPFDRTKMVISDEAMRLAKAFYEENIKDFHTLWVTFAMPAFSYTSMKVTMRQGSFKGTRREMTAPEVKDMKLKFGEEDDDDLTWSFLEVEIMKQTSTTADNDK